MWIETSREVYSVIWARHEKELCVHSSFTDSTGNGYHFSTGKPEVITEWGFKDSDKPLMKSEQKKEKESQKEWNVRFYLYYEKQ